MRWWVSYSFQEAIAKISEISSGEAAVVELYGNDGIRKFVSNVRANRDDISPEYMGMRSQ